MRVMLAELAEERDIFWGGNQIIMFFGLFFITDGYILALELEGRTLPTETIRLGRAK